MASEMTPTRRALAAVLGGRTDYVPPANPLAQTTADMMEFTNEAAFWVFNQVTNFAYTRRR